MKKRIHISVQKSSALVLGATFLFLITSCQYFTKTDLKSAAVAKVYDKELLQSDLHRVVPNNLSPSDSADFARTYIKAWVEEQLIIKKAELNLNINQEELNARVEAYRNSLITYAYQKELVEQQLDTTITNQQIEEYYNEHKEDFRLKDFIVRVVFIKVDKAERDLAKARYWIQFTLPDHKEKLLDFCNEKAENYYFDEENWLFLDELLNDVPIKPENKEYYLKKNGYYEFYDNESIFLLKVLDFRLKDSTSPLVLEKQNIRNILLNIRKLEMIEKMKKDIYQDALSKKQIEIYAN